MALHVTQCPSCDSTFNTSARMLESSGGLVRCGACLSVFAASENFISTTETTATENNAGDEDGSVFISGQEDYFDPGRFLADGEPAKDKTDDLDIHQTFSYTMRPAGSRDSAKNPVQATAESTLDELDPDITDHDFVIKPGAEPTTVDSDFDDSSPESAESNQLSPEAIAAADSPETDFLFGDETDEMLAVDNPGADDASEIPDAHSTDNPSGDRHPDQAGSRHEQDLRLEAIDTDDTSQNDEADWLDVSINDVDQPQQPGEAPSQQHPATDIAIEADEDSTGPADTDDSMAAADNSEEFVTETTVLSDDDIESLESLLAEPEEDTMTDQNLVLEPLDGYQDPDTQIQSHDYAPVPVPEHDGAETLAAPEGESDEDPWALKSHPATASEPDSEVPEMDPEAAADLHSDDSAFDPGTTQSDAGNRPDSNITPRPGYDIGNASDPENPDPATAGDDRDDGEDRDRTDHENKSADPGDLKTDTDATPTPPVEPDYYDDADSDSSSVYDNLAFLPAADAWKSTSTGDAPRNEESETPSTDSRTADPVTEDDSNDSGHPDLDLTLDSVSDGQPDLDLTDEELAASAVADFENLESQLERYTLESDSKAEIRARLTARDLRERTELESLSSENVAAVKKVDSSLQLDNRKSPGLRRYKKAIRPLAIFLLLTGLIAVAFLWIRMPVLSLNPNLRPWYETACGVLPCNLAPMRDIASIRIQNLVVRSHPDIENSLIVNAVFSNQATFQQPFPVLQLRFTDIDNQLLATRNFSPSDYLPQALSAISAMPVGTPVQISMVLRDPGEEATNYQLEVIATTDN